MLIGELATRAEVSIDTIRYYEREGLIEPTAVRESGYREFDEDAVSDLCFVLRAKHLGFSLKEIRGLLQLRKGPDTSCGEVRALAEVKLDQVQEKISSLRIIEKDLGTLIKNCDSVSENSKACPIVDALDGKDTER